MLSMTEQLKPLSHFDKLSFPEVCIKGSDGFDWLGEFILASNHEQNMQFSI